MSIEIRLARPEDTELLFDIRCSVVENLQTRDELAALGITPDTVREMIESGDYASFVARYDGVDAGFTMAQISEGYVFACFVHRAYEGKGIGRKLMEATEKELSRNGVEVAWLSTGADEALRAVGFYRALGWLEKGKLEDGQIRFEKSLKIAEQGDAPNAHPRHASCLSLRSGTSRATGERG